MSDPMAIRGNKPFEVYDRLRNAALALYRGGQWQAPGVSPERADALWKELRDALGMPPGSTSNKIDAPVMTNTPRAGEAPGARDRSALADITREINGAYEFVTELRKARAKFGPMASAHEGYAVILEELDEIWDIVKQKQTARNYADLRKEIVQLGAMALAFLVEIVDTDNRK